MLPAVGYTHPDQSHFTSRHYWEVGATDARAAHRLARPLPRQDRDEEQPAAGAVARRHARARARHGVGAGRGDLDARTTTTSTRTASGARSRSGCSRRSGCSEPARRPGAAHRRRRRGAGRPAAAAAAAVPVAGRKPGYTSPVTYPTSDDDFPKRLAGLAAMLGAGLPLHCDRAERLPARTTRIRTRPAPSPTGCSSRRTRCSRSSATSRRAGSPNRVLVHVWTEFGRRAEENGDAGTDHGAAGTGFLIGSRVTGTDGRRVPGPPDRPRQRRQPRSRPPTSAASTPRCSSSGSASTRPP